MFTNLGDIMETKDLKNYEKSLLEMMGSVPHEIQKEISDASSSIMIKHLNSDDLKHFAAFWGI